MFPRRSSAVRMSLLLGDLLLTAGARRQDKGDGPPAVAVTAAKQN